MADVQSMIDVDVGQRVQALRREQGLNQRQLGARIGVGQSDMSALENGQRRWTVKMLHEAASALNVDPARLLVGESEVGRLAARAVAEGKTVVIYAS